MGEKLQTESGISSAHAKTESRVMKPEAKLEAIPRLPKTIKPEPPIFGSSTTSARAFSSKEILGARRRRQDTVAEINRA